MKKTTSGTPTPTAIEIGGVLGGPTKAPIAPSNKTSSNQMIRTIDTLNETRPAQKLEYDFRGDERRYSLQSP